MTPESHGLLHRTDLQYVIAVSQSSDSKLAILVADRCGNNFVAVQQMHVQTRNRLSRRIQN